MGKQRKTYSAEIKVKIALEAIKGQRTINEIAATTACIPIR
jgi:transposase-like protein